MVVWTGGSRRGPPLAPSRGNVAVLGHTVLLLGWLSAAVATGEGTRVAGLHDLYRPRVDPDGHQHHAGLQQLLDVYQPRALRLGPDVEEPCHQHLASFLAHLDNGTAWAERMWDSSGRYSSQMLWGNNFWLGSLTQCDDLNNPERRLPFLVHFYVSSLLLNMSVSTPQVRQVSLGVCLPASCSVSDVTTFLNTSHAPGIQVTKTRAVPDPSYTLWTQPALYLAGLLAAVAVILVLVASVVDLVLRHKRKMKVTTPNENTGDAECNGNNLSYTATGPEREEAKTKKTEDEPRQPGRATELLLCFSAVSNVAKICDTGAAEALGCLHGLRVFSLVWVIAGHSCMFAFPFSDNKGFRRLVERDFLFQSISSGAFSVDTFFFISGILVAYVFRKAGIRPATESLWACVRSQVEHFAGVFSYRYCRLILPYVFVLLVNQLTTEWFHRNSVFDTPTLDHLNCQHYWWRNLLFINTLFPVKDMCMVWSWYLANDMQFYTLAIILLLVSARYFKFATGCLFLLLASSWFTTGFIALYSQHVPSIEEPLGLFDQLYDKPWTRLGPYVVGMATGWLLHRTGCELHLHKVAVVVGWVVAMGTTFVLVHGLYGDLGPFASAAYVSLGHTGWACALAWIVIACCTGYGGYANKLLSARIWFPLSRLTYCAYLVHPIIMVTAIMHNDGPIHLTRDTMVMTIFGNLVSSYALSLLLSLAFEAPSIALLNLLHPIRRLAK